MYIRPFASRAPQLTSEISFHCEHDLKIVQERGTRKKAVLILKILVIQAAIGLSDDRAKFPINDRLSFMRFLGLGLSDRVPSTRPL